MKTSVVVGLQFGDEGKGGMTSLLSSQSRRPLVVRFNGGHQAGHTVERDGYRHIFSNFGSGSLHGADTYWSRFCTFYPPAFAEEQRMLKANGYTPHFMIDPMAMVTTPFDVEANIKSERKQQHGSVGVGFGTTVARHETSPIKIHAVDLTCPDILVHKLRQVALHYHSFLTPSANFTIDRFVEDCQKAEFTIAPLRVAFGYDHVIFEGAQGILLDRDFGYFPHVTRSHTTSRNAMELIREYHFPEVQLYYCMRSYLTRHGNGPMPNERKSLFEDRTNLTHAYQGSFRQGSHSLSHLRYALECDRIYSGQERINLSLICMDQTEQQVLLDHQGYDLDDFIIKLGVDFHDVMDNSRSRKIAVV